MGQSQKKRAGCRSSAPGDRLARRRCWLPAGHYRVGVAVEGPKVNGGRPLVGRCGAAERLGDGGDVSVQRCTPGRRLPVDRALARDDRDFVQAHVDFRIPISTGFGPRRGGSGHRCWATGTRRQAGLRRRRRHADDARRRGIRPVGFATSAGSTRAARSISRSRTMEVAFTSTTTRSSFPLTSSSSERGFSHTNFSSHTKSTRNSPTLAARYSGSSETTTSGCSSTDVSRSTSAGCTRSSLRRPTSTYWRVNWG